MPTIRVSLEYGCYPIWTREHEWDIQDNEIPEFLAKDEEFVAMSKKISDDHKALFINTPIEFGWKGFDDEAHLKRFADEVNTYIALLKEKAAGKYEIIVDVHPESYTLED